MKRRYTGQRDHNHNSAAFGFEAELLLRRSR